jgi:N-acetylneuraminic acid mutarotase
MLAWLLAIGLATGITCSVQSGTFTLTTLLGNGEVLVTGGLGVNGAYTTLASAELYDPKKGKWTVTGSMSVGRSAFTATLLQNGEVLVAGGTDFEINC